MTRDLRLVLVVEDLDPGWVQAETLDDQGLPSSDRGGIITVEEVVGLLRPCHTSAREARVAKSQAVLEGLGVFTPDGGQLIEDEGPELDVRIVRVVAEFVTGQDAP